MPSSDITITHHLTGKGTGRLTAGQQQQLSALVPADATTTTRTEDGSLLSASKWTWTATWTAEQDQEWRAAQQPDNPLPADWTAHLADFDAAVPREGHADFCTIEHLPGVSPCRRLVPAPTDVDPRCGHPHPTGAGVMTCGLPAGHRGEHRNQGNNPGYSWDAAGNYTHDAIDTYRTEDSDPNTDPDYPKFMADGKTVRCRAVSDGTHGYVAGSQCTRVSGHDTPRNIVGHYYPRNPKPKDS